MQEALATALTIVASSYARSRRIGMTTLARKAAGDWRFFERLDDPSKTFTVRKYEEVLQWFSDNWPVDVSWPAEVERPSGNSKSIMACTKVESEPARGAAI